MDPGAPQSESCVRVYSLGAFRVLVDGCVVADSAWRRRSARQLFKVLLTRRGQHVARDEVIEHFWPESGLEAAASNLRSTVYAVRHALQPATRERVPDVVLSDHASLWLTTASDLWTDADAFEQLVAAGWRSADPLPLLEQASTLYGGDYLPDDLYEDWAAERREALRHTWTDLQFGLAKALESRSDVNAALQPLERILRVDACDERATQELMQLLSRHGRRAEALRVFQRLERSLRDELEVDPSPESVELQRQISAGVSVAVPNTPSTSFRCTYPFPSPCELVGRESELAALEQVVATGRTAGRVAFISAPAGTGKSALVGQIVHEVENQGTLCLAGGCYTERGAVPFGPFHDALVDYFLAQPPDHVRELLGSSIDDLATLVPELRYHLGLNGDGPEAGSIDRMHALGVVHACLRSLAERGPLLVCLEDLHAADEPTLQLLHYLARQTRRLPIVFLATQRDEGSADRLLGQTVAAMLRERLAQKFVLGPLDREQTNRLATHLLDGPPSQELGESLYATSGGNPLFVEELVLGLREGGQLEDRAGMWHMSLDFQGAPHVVRDVIAQRIQRLDSDCRQILAIASVLGESFDRGALFAAVEALDEAVVLAGLDQASTAHVLRQTRDGYAFQHGSLREAVYWGMTAPRRMLLHARVGEVLERRFGDTPADHASELAYHFSLAGDSRTMRARTLRYSLLAGQRALTRSSYAEAHEQFERAAHVLDADISLGSPLDRIAATRGRGLAEANLAREARALTK
jgi:DNA-binding SARP family transcriptional activator